MQPEPISAFIQCLKQLGNSSSPSPQTDEYTNLTRSYREAQTRILDLEQSLMEETLCNERQRSLIQVLKQALHEENDDMSTLSFISSLNEEMEGDAEMRKVLEEVQDVLKVRQRKGEKQNQKRMVEISIRCEELEGELGCWMEKVGEMEERLEGEERRRKQIEREMDLQTKKYNDSCEDNGRIRCEAVETELVIKEMRQAMSGASKELGWSKEENQRLRKELKESEETALELQRNWKEADTVLEKCQGESKQQLKLIEEMQQLVGGNRANLKIRMEKVIKNYKFLKWRAGCSKGGKENSFVNSLKQFLSESALDLVSQIEENQSPHYLYRELQELCSLEKQELVHLKSQERELRRCRVQLLRAQEGGGVLTSRDFSTKVKLRDLELTGRFDGAFEETSEFRI